MAIISTPYAFSWARDIMKLRANVKLHHCKENRSASVGFLCRAMRPSRARQDRRAGIRRVASAYIRAGKPNASLIFCWFFLHRPERSNKQKSKIECRRRIGGNGDSNEI